ncbi:unnamed protein product [Ceutorhynchus assimilis]|uniref:Attacin C-terminal domain-containing protein n=1 Tax=Ceutorhynchus assimilis TaxID=467358 RepID=A0A9N9MUN3_9CUCU|nr:unnamed protein product [Ceutorhynchus assimilis]
MVKFVVIFSVALLAVASALPVMVQDDQGQQYYLEPVDLLSRHRRDEPRLPGPNDPKAFGQYGANGKTQGGFLSYQNPDGSGLSVGHGHHNGFGHTVSVDGAYPIWSSKNGFGQSTVNLGAGATNHYGGWPGNMNLDKRVGLSFNHRF